MGENGTTLQPMAPQDSMDHNEAVVKDNDVTCSERAKTFLKDNLLMELSLVGVVLGFIIGFVVRREEPSEEAIMWLGLPGEIFLSLLKMTIVPVIVSSVISATATMDPKENGKICGILMAYLVLTNLIGAGLGVLMGLTMRLGSTHDDGTSSQYKEVESSLKTSDIIADIFRNLFPSNLVRATMQKSQTDYASADVVVEVNTSEGLVNVTMKELTRSVIYVDSVNVMGIIFGSVLFGLACTRMGERAKPFVDFFSASTDVILVILQWLLWSAPIGVLSLVAASIADIKDLERIFSQLGVFVVAVTVGLIIQQVILFPIMYFVFTRTNPFKAYLKMMKAWFIAFASASSACTMPYMYHACEDLGYDPRVYKFGIPMMVTFNANGSAVFICVAAQVLAMISGIEVGIGRLVVVWLLTTITCMGLPSVPSGSLIAVIIICTTLNIPPASVGLLIAVEWFLDRLRTTSNVMSEIMGVGVTNALVKKDLRDRVDETWLEPPSGRKRSTAP